MDGRECRGVRERATAINAVLMHYIEIPGTDKVSHGVQCAGRDKGGLKSFPSFISWFYPEVKYSILMYVERKRQLRRQRGEKNERRHL